MSAKINRSTKPGDLLRCVFCNRECDLEESMLSWWERELPESKKPLVFMSGLTCNRAQCMHVAESIGNLRDIHAHQTDLEEVERIVELYPWDGPALKRFILVAFAAMKETGEL